MLYTWVWLGFEMQAVNIDYLLNITQTPKPKPLLNLN